MSFLEKIIEPRKQIPEERKRFDNNFLKQLILRFDLPFGNDAKDLALSA